ncbi:MAG: MazF family transcriptional regulator [bacterium]
MGTPAVRSVVLVTFPFSDLSASKLRPAVVLADVGRDDYILCQMTSNPYADPDAVRLGDSDFASGSLHHVSYARPGKLFTANAALITGSVGELSEASQRVIIDRVVALFRR